MVLNSKHLSYLLAIYCCFLPFEEALASSLGSILRWIGIVLIGCIAFIYKGQWKVSKFHYPLLLWIAYMLLSCVWADSLEWWSYFFKIYLLQIIFLLSIDMIKIDKINMNLIRSALIVGSTLASIVLLVIPSSQGFTDEGRRTIVLFGGTLDPNIVASIMLVGIQITLFNIYKFTKNKFKYILLLSIQFLGLLMTGSRGALIALVASFIIEILMKLLNGEDRKKTFKILLVCLITSIIVFQLLPETLIESRFSIDNILGINEVKTGSHNRYTIWTYAISLIKSNPIIGYGCGNFFSAIETVYKTCASHNIYILLIVEGGIIGFVLFTSYLFKIIKKLYIQDDYSTLSVLFAVLIMGASLDSITYKYFWITIIYCILKMKENKKNRGEIS